MTVINIVTYNCSSSVTKIEVFNKTLLLFLPTLVSLESNSKVKLPAFLYSICKVLGCCLDFDVAGRGFAVAKWGSHDTYQTV